MTTVLQSTEAAAHAEQLSGRLEALSVRRGELEQRAEQLHASLADARSRWGRAIADRASDKRLAPLGNEVRSIDDELQATVAALKTIAADIRTAEAGLAEAETDAAVDLARAKAVAALEARDRVATVVDRFGVELLGVLATYETVSDEASAAIAAALARLKRVRGKATGLETPEFRLGYGPVGLRDTLAAVRPALEAYAGGQTSAQRSERNLRGLADAIDEGRRTGFVTAVGTPAPPPAPWTPAHPHALDVLLKRYDSEDIAAPDPGA
jgi:hypothetical protein